MGIFNNEYRIVVGVSSQQLIKGKYTELRDSVLDALFNKREVTENLKGTLNNGMSASVQKYTRFAHRKLGKNFIDVGTYFRGLTFSESVYGDLGAPIITKTYDHYKYFFYPVEEIQALFQSYRAGELCTNYHWQDRYNPLKYLREVYAPTWLGWDSTSTFIRIVPPDISGLTGFLGMTWAGTFETMVLHEWGPSLRTTLHFADGSSREHEYIPLDVGGWMGDGKDLLWMQSDQGSVEIPVSSLPLDLIDIIRNSVYTEDAIYTPTVSIRNTKVNLVDEPNSEYYSPVSKALNAIGIDMDTVTAAIMSTADGNDPEIVDDAFIGFGANIRSDNQIVINYMFDFFNYAIQCGYNQPKSKWDAFADHAAGSVLDFWLDQQYMNMQIAGGEGTVNSTYLHTIRWIWNSRTLTTGTIGPVGTVLKNAILRDYLDVGGFEVDNSSLILRKQVAVNQIIEIEIRGLSWVGQTYPGAFAYYRMTEYEDDGKNHIYLPLVRGLWEQYGVFEQGELFKESLVLTVFAKDVVKIPWYLREEFLKTIQIILIVYSIITFNPQGATYIEVLKQLAIEGLKQIIITMIIGEVIKQLVDLLGTKNTELLIILAVIYSAYQYTIGNTGWAESLLKETFLAQNSLNNIIKDDYEKILEDIKTRDKEYKDAFDAIEKVNEEMFAPDISHLFARRYLFKFDPNETPDQFFNRTVHSTNITEPSIDYVGSFVSNLLQLPKNRDFGG